MRYSALLFVALMFTACGGDGTPVPSATVTLAVTPTATASSPLAGSWNEGAPMPNARSEITSAVLDGKIYVIGGFEASGNDTGAVEVYDPETNAWDSVAPVVPALNHGMAAAVNGKLYVFGGFTVSGDQIIGETREYEPASDTWTSRASMPDFQADGHGPQVRAAGAAVALNGLIYIVGGVGSQATVPFAYDPSSDSWRELAPMPAPREHLTAQAVGGKIYVIGGRWQGVNVATVEAYDPQSDTWEVLAPMPAARGGLTSAVFDGRIHVFGGEDVAARRTFSEHEVYDPATDRWTAAPPLPTARHGLAAQTASGRIYVIGGGPQAALSTSPLVEVFSPGE